MRAGLATGAKALSACEWCPRFFFNTSAPGATSVTVRALRGRAAMTAACAPLTPPAFHAQNCSFMPQSAATNGPRLRLRTVLLLAAALACMLC
jgi:hypothetical protein